MKTYYISPSTIPSRSANSIHVVNMCEALTQLAHDVVLFVRSKELDSLACREVIRDFYGVANEGIETVSYRSKEPRGAELGIALRAFFRFVKDALKGEVPKFIMSRNLYAAVLLGLLFRRAVVYETHSPEKGIRKKLQRRLLSSNKIQTVVISEALRKVILDLHGITNERIHVFHDAARAGQSRMNAPERHEVQQVLLGSVVDLERYDKIVGYFGHLYSGRGIEIIEGLAHRNPDYAFVVYGGNEKEIAHFKEKNSSNNLFFMGYLSPDNVRKAMAMMSVLLMPYQKSVSIGLDGVDTVQWMSPMKMFEYMSVGVPIVSSDLPVLREVLTHRETCLLVQSDDIDAWQQALNQLIETPELAKKIGLRAHEAYKKNYTWSVRTKKILEVAKVL